MGDILHLPGSGDDPPLSPEQKMMLLKLEHQQILGAEGELVPLYTAFQERLKMFRQRKKDIEKELKKLRAGSLIVTDQMPPEPEAKG